MGSPRTAQLPFASSLCGACRDVCPVKIDIPALLLDLRAEVVEGPPGPAPPVRATKRKLAERLIFRFYAFACARPKLYEWSGRIARLLQPAAVRRGRIGKVGGVAAALLPALEAWTAGRDARPFARRSFRAQWRDSQSRKRDRDEGEGEGSRG
jgi:L-lactate dehydrogenase complex protein LldF